MMNILRDRLHRLDYQKKPSTNKRTILIISRSEERIKTINQQIFSLGYSCVKEPSCEQAIETLKIIKFSVIFIDLDIPREEALSMIAWIEEYYPDANVFFIGPNGKCFEFYKTKKQSSSPISYSEKNLNEILRMRE